MKFKRITNLLFSIAVSLLCVNPAMADQFLALTGVDVSEHSDYVYLGGVAQLDHPSDQSGALAKLWIYHLNYDYLDAKKKIDASADGEQVSLGYQWIRPTGLISVYLGIGSRDTRLPHNVNSSQKGRLTGAIAEIDLNQDLGGDLVFGGIFSYSERSKDYWNRFRLMDKMSSGLRLGPELILQGSPDYSASRLGLAMSGINLGKFSLEGSVGYTKTEGIRGGGYAGINAAYPF